MTDLSAMEPFGEAVEDYRQQARDFLSRSWDYLDENDLHQASEKGWVTGVWMEKAVAGTHGWSYTQHGQFFQVMCRCQELAGDGRIRSFTATDDLLHTYFYTRKRLLSADTIGENLADME